MQLVLVVLRGDSSDATTEQSDFHYASDLLKYIREKTGDQFKMSVAAYPEFHPQAESSTMDLLNLKNKENLGANEAITQYFFDPNAYYQLIESCSNQQIDMPIIPGIIPIHDYEKLSKFSACCGADVPAWLDKRLQVYKSDKDFFKLYGTQVITKLCQDLLSFGIPELHFYTLNKSEFVTEILNNLYQA